MLHCEFIPSRRPQIQNQFVTYWLKPVVLINNYIAGAAAAATCCTAFLSLSPPFSDQHRTLCSPFEVRTYGYGSFADCAEVHLKNKHRIDIEAPVVLTRPSIHGSVCVCWAVSNSVNCSIWTETERSTFHVSVCARFVASFQLPPTHCKYFYSNFSFVCAFRWRQNDASGMQHSLNHRNGAHTTCNA